MYASKQIYGSEVTLRDVFQNKFKFYSFITNWTNKWHKVFLFFLKVG